MKKFLIFISLCTTTLFAQDLKTDAEKINRFFSEHPKLTAQIDYNMYETYTSSVIYSKTTAFVKKLNERVYSKIEETETIKCDDYTLVVDNENKVISLLPKKTGIKSDPKDFAFDLAYFQTLCKKSAYAKEGKQSASYSFDMKDNFPEYNRIKILFNTSSFCIEKVIIYYDETDISQGDEKDRAGKPRLEINYTKVDTKADVKYEEVSYEKFLFKTGGKYSLKPAYAGYTLNTYSL